MSYQAVYDVCTIENNKVLTSINSQEVQVLTYFSLPRFHYIFELAFFRLVIFSIWFPLLDLVCDHHN